MDIDLRGSGIEFGVAAVRNLRRIRKKWYPSNLKCWNALERILD